MIADAIHAGARYLVTTDVDDFANEGLQVHGMSAVDPDYFMALRFSEHAYREGVHTLAEVAKDPPRTAAEVHKMLGRRHPNVTARFVDVYGTTPVLPDPYQPSVLFCGTICVRCESQLIDTRSKQPGPCPERRGRSSAR